MRRKNIIIWHGSLRHKLRCTIVNNRGRKTIFPNLLINKYNPTCVMSQWVARKISLFKFFENSDWSGNFFVRFCISTTISFHLINVSVNTITHQDAAREKTRFVRYLPRVNNYNDACFYIMWASLKSRLLTLHTEHLNEKRL